MKTLVIILILAFSASISHAQQVIELNEAKVGFNPLSGIDGPVKQISVKISESVPGEFEKDPIAFVKSNFDISPYLAQTPNEQFYSYQVTFKTRKGHLMADFDDKGNLVKTSQKFENIVLPLDLSKQLYRDHKGWEMVKNKVVAHGKKDKIDKAVYRVTMQNGKQKRNLKYEVAPETSDAIVAVN